MYKVKPIIFFFYICFSSEICYELYYHQMGFAGDDVLLSSFLDSFQILFALTRRQIITFPYRWKTKFQFD